MKAARWMCAALALVVVVWFAIGARQAIDSTHASAIANRTKTASAAEVREVRSLVHGARLLNPDQQPNVTLAQAEVEHGDSGRARVLLEQVTRREPQNFEAWLWLAHAATSPAFLQAALSRLCALDPHQPVSCRGAHAPARPATG